MSRTTVLRTFLVGAPLAFAAILTQHPMSTGDFFEEISANVGAWLAVHYAAALFFPLMALVVWLLIRDVPGRAATVARMALPVYAVAYGVWEAMFGIANGLLAETGNTLGGEARQGVVEASERIVSSPWVGETGVFSAVGAGAWIVAVCASIVALKHAGAPRAALVLLGLGALTVFHVPPFGPIALACLAAGAYLVERRRSAAPDERRDLVPA